MDELDTLGVAFLLEALNLPCECATDRPCHECRVGYQRWWGLHPDEIYVPTPREPRLHRVAFAGYGHRAAQL